MNFRPGGFIVGVFFLVPATRAAAQGLAYSAPSECPPGEEVVARLRERTGREPAARVHIRKFGGRYAALVSLGNDPDASRTMIGDTCDGVVEAALLVLAMAPSGDEPEPPKDAPPEPPPVVPPATAPPPDRSAESHHQARHSLPFGVATGLMLGADAFSEGRWAFAFGSSIAFEWRRGALDVAWLKPRLALGTSTTLDMTMRSPFATSDYSRVMGFVEACPTSHEIGQVVRVALRPCARLTGSLVSLETTSLIDPNTFGGGSFKTGTWSTAGVLGRLRFSFDAPPWASDGAVFLEVFGGGDLTLTADRFRMLGRPPIGPDAAVASFGLVTGTSW